MIFFEITTSFIVNNKVNVKLFNYEKRTITLSDIAKKLNVSAVTVSKALRNHPDISKKTKDLVIKTAEKMGYTPNYMAKKSFIKKNKYDWISCPKNCSFFFRFHY